MEELEAKFGTAWGSSGGDSLRQNNSPAWAPIERWKILAHCTAAQFHLGLGKCQVQAICGVRWLIGNKEEGALRVTREIGNLGALLLHICLCQFFTQPCCNGCRRRRRRTSGFLGRRGSWSYLLSSNLLLLSGRLCCSVSFPGPLLLRGCLYRGHLTRSMGQIALL